MAQDALLQGIEDWLGRPRDKAVTDKVSKYVTKLGSSGMGEVAQERVLTIGQPEVNSAKAASPDAQFSPVQAFFSPVGYRPLFEQEILLLLNEGLDYESVMRMPVHLRKRLVDKKLERNNPASAADGEPDIPPALLEQFRMAAKERRAVESPLPVRG